MKFRLEQLEVRARWQSDGFAKAVLARAEKTSDGGFEIEENELLRLITEFARQKVGLGDLVGRVATPIAAALHLNCVDPTTKQLRPESPCAKRKAVLNGIMPDIRHPLDKAPNK